MKIIQKQNITNKYLSFFQEIIANTFGLMDFNTNGIEQEECIFSLQEYFKDNQRMGMMLNLLNKMNKETLEAHKKRAEHIIQNPNEY